MKSLPVILAFCLCSGCTTFQKLVPKKKEPAPEKTTAAPSRKKSKKVRTDELVKAYPVGRYSDPDSPDVMHERHTVYRVEQSPNWDYLPDSPDALPMGPSAGSAPSSSYYVKADAELMTGQQRAQVDALREQNRALQERIGSLEKEQSNNQQLQAEIDRLKKERAALPAPEPTPTPTPSSESAGEPWSEFSNPN